MIDEAADHRTLKHVYRVRNSDGAILHGGGSTNAHPLVLRPKPGTTIREYQRPPALGEKDDGAGNLVAKSPAEIAEYDTEVKRKKREQEFDTAHDAIVELTLEELREHGAPKTETAVAAAKARIKQKYLD